MKFVVSMKDPDTLDDSIARAVSQEVGALGLDEEETAAIAELRVEKIRGQCSKWFEYGEYLRVEIDTDAGTCTVVSRNG